MSVEEIISRLNTLEVDVKLVGPDLEIEGDELSPELILHLKENKNEIIEYLKADERLTHELVPLEQQSHYPLSHAQKRMWIIDQLAGTKGAYNLCASYELDDFSLDVIKMGLARLIERHEILRTVFVLLDGEPRQRVIDFANHQPSIFEFDLSEQQDSDRFILEKIREESSFEFELSKEAPFRASIIRKKGDQFVLIISMHHIIGDGWSFKNLANDFQKLVSNKLPLPKLNYKDFAVYQNLKFQDGRRTSEEVFWMSLFSSDLEVLDLDTDFARPPIKTYNGSSVMLQFSEELSEGLRELSLKNHGSVFTGLLSLVYTVLYHYTSQSSITVGTPFSLRNDLELEDQVGLYANTLPLKVNVGSEDTFDSLFGKVRRQVLDASSNQSYPFDLLVDKLDLAVDLSRNPLFDILVNYEKIDGKWIGNTSNLSDTNQGSKSKFDLTFTFHEYEDVISLSIDFNTDLFEKGRIDTLGRHLIRLCKNIVDSPTNPITSNDFISDEEKEVLNKLSSGSNLELPNDLTFLDLFAKKVSEHPDQVGASDNADSYTYRQIDEESNRIATYLAREINRDEHPIIALVTDRSVQMLTTILGILKAGFAYLALDPKYPKDRLGAMIADANVRHLLYNLSDFELPETQPGELEMISIEAVLSDPPSESNAIDGPKQEDMAYVIYTSGSTGKPKGVTISHRNLINRLLWAVKEFEKDHYSVLYATTSYCFDLSVFELFLPLISSKKLRILDSGLEIPAAISADSDVLINTVPSVVSWLVDQQIDWTPVQSLNMAGEVIPQLVLDRLPTEGIKVRNLYGPSEDTTYSTGYLFTGGEEEVPIGRPLDNTQIYVLDGTNNVLPVGIKGEICIGGTGLAMGYINRPELTHDRFVAHPFRPGERLYRTGDLGKWNQSGELVFLGRKDDQLKLRGYRVEPGEIAFHLGQITGVDQAIVLLSGEQQLVAFYTGTSIASDQLTDHLSAELPSYMVPSHFIHLDQFPLTPNGKIDRKPLQVLADTHEGEATFVPPAPGDETMLAGIWQEVLSVKEVGSRDHFFQLGGHSLKAMQVISRIFQQAGKNVSLADFFAHPVLADLARVVGVASSEESSLPTIPLAPEMADYPLSHAQKRLWVLEQFGQSQGAYHIPLSYTLQQANAEAITYAIHQLINRHEALRTVFKVDQGIPRQLILPFDAETFGIRQVTFISEEDPDQSADAWIAVFIAEPFALDEPPLVRTAMIQTRPDEYTILMVLHHIIADGWSIKLLEEEFSFYYHEYESTDRRGLPTLEIQYKDVAYWQLEQLERGALDEDREFWLSQFADTPPVLDLPTDFHRPAIKTYSGSTESFTLDEELTAQLTRFCEQQQVSLFMGLHAVLNVLLYRYTGQRDLVVGTPIAGRNHPQTEDQVGFYVNTLPLRMRVDPEECFVDFVQRVKSLTLQAFDHQQFPFDLLVEMLDLPRDLSRSPLFDVSINMQNIDHTGLHPSETDQKYQVQAQEDINDKTTKFDLTFTFHEYDNVIGLGIDFNTNLFERSRIDALGRHLIRLCKNIVDSPTSPITSSDFLSDEEEEVLNKLSFGSKLELPNDLTFLDLFAEKVKEHPDQAGVSDNVNTYTYRQIDEESDRIAAYLTHGIDKDEHPIIALATDRSVQMLTTILGILKAGFAYLALDPKYPKDRLGAMIADADVKYLLSNLPDFEVSAAQSELEMIFIDEILSGPVVESNAITGPSPEDIAYIIYTSGSTGKPKGVTLSHQNVINRLLWAIKEFEADDYEVLYATTSYCFDLSVFELFLPLISSKQLRILDSGLEIPSVLSKDSDVLINTVPSVVSWLLDQQIDWAPVRSLNMAGEVIPQLVLEQLSSEVVKVRNLYGPSEDTTYSTGYLFEGGEEEVPIGRPLDNTQVYVLDDTNNMLPVGIKGEICIGGMGLAMGYLNRPELTRDRFVAHPFRPGERLYRTGDLGKWNQSGELVFLGRKDDQLKLRGYRVEPGEIAFHLGQVTGVDQAIVLLSGEQQLVAFYTGTSIASDQLTDHLSAELPSYMVPSHFIHLDQFPLTPNGKIDRKPLQVLADTHEGEATFVPPAPGDETMLAGIWQEVLSVKEVGSRDHFFQLGGHSLKAMQVISRVFQQTGKNVPLAALFAHPVLADFAHVIEGTASEESSFPTIPLAPEQVDYPLSHAQKRLWVLEQFGQSQGAYHIPLSYTLYQVNTDAIIYAIHQLIRRHESLRTVFKVDQGTPRQLILPFDAETFRIAQVNFMDEEDPDQAASAWVSAFIEEPFALEEPPLIRTAVIQTDPDECTILMVLHHIIADGWSIKLLEEEFSFYYHAFESQDSSELPELELQYKDVAYWQLEQLEGGAMDEDRAFWMSLFADTPPVLDLPIDFHRPAIKTYRGSTLSYTLNEEMTTQLTRFCEEQQVSLFMGLNAVLNVLLYRYTGQQDLVVGTPIAGRNHPQTEDQVGFYVNTLPLRMKIDPEECFVDFVQRVKSLTLQAFDHQQFPFDLLVEMLDLPRDLSRSPLFDVSINMQNIDHTGLHPSETDQKYQVQAQEDVNDNTTKFDLEWGFASQDGRVSASLTYNPDLFEEHTVKRMINHFIDLAGALLDESKKSLFTLEFLSRQELEKLLSGMETCNKVLPEDVMVSYVFEKQVEITPDAIAFQSASTSLTYEELNSQANRLAHRLIDEYSINKGQLVGIIANRSEWLLISILSVTKTGAAYVPIDPQYPNQRIKFIIDDTGMSLLLTEKEALEIEGKLLGLPTLFLSDTETQDWGKFPVFNPERKISLDDTAYVIYTSGSTGTPKGVVVKHRSLLNLVSWHDNTFQVSYKSKGTLYAGIGFDASVWEIWPYLICGAQLIAIPDAVRLDIPSLCNFLDEKEITHTFLPTAICQEIPEEVELPGVQVVLTGGDHLKASNKKIRIVNNYGLTEATVVSTSCLIDSEGAEVPIGSPVQNTQVYLLDDYLQLVPMGSTGEICIGGMGLAMGYLNRPELTHDRFVAHPFRPGERLYRAGDLGKWNQSGELVFLGRKDDQLKLRGYRVEPGEIAFHLGQVTGVDQAIVLLSGEQQLVAFYTGTSIASDQLTDHLSAELPSYMVPSHFIHLDQFPLTPNGKIDRKPLQVLADTHEGEATFVPPAPGDETMLAGIWQEVLSVKEVGSRDHFFQLGGHSLKAMQVISRIFQQAGKNVSLADFFAHPVLADLARVVGVASSEESSLPTIPLAPEMADYPLSHAQKRLWVLEQFGQSQGAYHIPLSYTLQQANAEAITYAIHQLINRHEALRTVFKVDQGIPRQLILPFDAETFGIRQVTFISEEDPDQSADAWIAVFIAEPFALDEPPLVRTAMIQTRPDEYTILMVLHHIIADGWSIKLLEEEFSFYYHEYESTDRRGLPTLEIQYKDVAYWQLERGALDEDREFWLSQFADTPPVLDLPTDFHRPAIKTYSGSTESFTLDEELTAQLTRFCEQQQVSLFMGLHAVLNVLLYRYTGQRDLVVGTPIAGRNHPQTEDQVGFYVNTLPLRMRVDPEECFVDFVQRVKSLTLQAFDHQQFPFDLLVEMLDLPRDLSRSPLFDVSVTMQNFSDLSSGSQDQKESTNPSGQHQHRVSQYDLSFIFEPVAEKVDLIIEYNTDLFKRSSAARMGDTFIAILKKLTEHSETVLNGFDLVSSNEINRIHSEFHRPAITEKTETVIGLFEAQVKKSPNKPAIKFQNAAWTYSQLANDAEKVHQFLRDNYSIKGESLIPIICQRSPSLIIAILGVLKSGAAFVPIDPDHPESRVRMILDDCNAKCVLDEPTIDSLLGDRDGAKLQSNTGQAVSSNLVYSIFTSGSTGRPKGVLIEHGQLMNTLNAEIHEYSLDESYTSILITNPSFDVSMLEIFLPLVLGGTLVIPEEEPMNDLNYLSDLIRNENVTDLQGTPIFFDNLVNYMDDSWSSLKRLCIGGESMDSDLVKKIQKVAGHVMINNHYGPTEMTIDATILSNIVDFERNLIGRPIPGIEVMILDDALNYQPIGVWGEIYFSGHSVARGYLNQPERSDIAFFDGPNGKKCYRTGDVGRWTEDGNIEFNGRKDQQVKIRGYRVELGEIEALFKEYPTIEQVVLGLDDSESTKRLVGYYTGEEVSQEELRNYLKGHIPNYMIPVLFVFLDRIPVTDNGKIDVKKLPSLSELGFEMASRYMAARNEKEKEIVKIWQKVLEKERIGIKDDFFELGGHSLKAIQIVSQINKNLNINATIADLYNYPNVQVFYDQFLGSHRVDDTDKQKSLLISMKEAIANKPEIFMIPPIAGLATVYQQVAQELSGKVNCFGLQYKGMEKGEKPAKSIEDLASTFYQEILAINTGFYKKIILGYSMGALIAFETAKLLEESGHTTELILLDQEVKTSSYTFEMEKQFDMDELYESLIQRPLKLQMGELNIEQAHLFKQLFNHNLKLQNDYMQSGKVRGDITVVECRKNTYPTNMADWKPFTLGQLESYFVDTNHFDLFENENVPIISGIISNVIDKKPMLAR